MPRGDITISHLSDPVHRDRELAHTLESALDVTQSNEKASWNAMNDGPRQSYGLVFISLTVGLMAVVLVLAMDNYIIGSNQLSCIIRS